MGWATKHIEKLQKGETVSFRPKGNSMVPMIKSGDLVTVEPIKNKLKEGDVVLCLVKGNQYLHLIKAIEWDKYQIGNNKGGINGWIGADKIFGLLVSVEV